MPELAEVEQSRKLAERVGAGRRIERAACADDEIVVEGARAAEVEAALVGARIEGAARRGKYFWLELDRRPWPLFHLGMTGSLRAPEAAPVRLASSPRDEAPDWPPRFCKLRLVLDDGGELAFVNKRRLGRLRLRVDPRREAPVADLGFDPWLDLPPPAAFRERLAGRRGNLKALLLDQSFAAGLGNWLADEILHEAGISPHRRADDLEGAEPEILRQAIGAVVRRAVEAEADSSRFPAHWLFHRRWARSDRSRREDGEEPLPGSLRRDRIAGRTTVWAPDRQR